MALRRMFSLRVVDTDVFLDMPLTTQALHFHLGMRADDDGFVASPNRIMRTIGASIDDLRVLISKQFIKKFDNGIIVILDWKRNNNIKNDRYYPTLYQTEKSQLAIENGRYVECLDPNKIQNGSTDKDR